MDQLLAPPRHQPVPLKRLTAQIHKAVSGPGEKAKEGASVDHLATHDPVWDNVGAALAGAVTRGARGSAAPDKSTTLSAQEQSALDKTVARLKDNDLVGAKTAFEGIGQKNSEEHDIQGYVQEVMYGCYLEGTEDLKDYADKVHDINEKKRELRGRLANIESTGPEGLIKDLEEQLSVLGDDSQLAAIDLQDWMQKQQQTLQTMSQVSKTLHDTALAVVRKLGD